MPELIVKGCGKVVRFFSIRTFPWFEEPQELRMEIRSSHLLKYGDVKKAVAEMLGLKKTSMAIFGLFRLVPSLFIIPGMLCCDSEPVAPGCEEFGFLRLSLSKNEEIKVLKSDKKAFNMIYWEALNFHVIGGMLSDPETSLDLILACLSLRERPGLDLIEHRIFIPRSEVKAVGKLNEDMRNDDYFTLVYNIKSSQAYINNVTTREKKEFLNAMHKCARYYWDYFYKVLGCKLCGDHLSLLSCCLCAEEELHHDVVMNSSSLVLLSFKPIKECCQLLAIPWSNICSISKNTSKQAFSFQILYEDKEGYVSYITISIWSRQFEYIYSMSTYFLQNLYRKKERRQNCKSPSNIEIDYGHFLSIALPSGLLSTPDNRSLQLYIPELSFPHDNQSQFFMNPNFIPALFGFQNAYISYSLQKEFTAHQKLAKCFRQKFAAHITRYGKKGENHHRHSKWDQGKVVSLRIGSIPLAGYNPNSPSESYMQVRGASKQEKKKCLRKNECKNISVYTFANKQPVKIEISSKTNTVAKLKKEVGRHLDLVPKSLNVFGLYTCSDVTFEKPISLCLENTPVESLNSVCFRRLSFIKRYEQTVWRRDRAAIKLLFAEAKYVLENELIYPRLAPGDFEKLKYLGDLSSISSGNVARAMERFMEALSECSPYWWEYYYRVEVHGCNLKEYFEPCKYILTHVSLTLDHIVLSDHVAEGIISIPWGRVSSVLMQQSAGGLLPEQLKLEIGTDEEDGVGHVTDKVLTAVSIDTTDIQLFFSLARHILYVYNHKVKLSKLMERQKFSSNHFYNTTFKGPGYVFYFPEPVSQHINKAFIGPKF